MNKLISIFFTAALFAAPAFAEIGELAESDDSPVESSDALKAFIGFNADDILLLEDGSFVFSVHGGVAINRNFRIGIVAATVANDVNTRSGGKNISVDYNALSLLAEVKPISFGKFSFSIPVTAGAGYINVNTQGEENSQAKDGFFVADAALHFNYQITPALEIGIGGGYRFFLGIAEDGFENSDFNTPFASLFINWGER